MFTELRGNFDSIRSSVWTGHFTVCTIPANLPCYCADERIDCETGPLGRLAFNSPPVTLCSPVLGVSAGKSGVGGGDTKITPPPSKSVYTILT